MTFPSVILITDPRYDAGHTRDVVRAAGEALGPGAFAVQLRDKTGSTARVHAKAESEAERAFGVRDARLIAAGRALRDVTRTVGALFIVNDSLDAARELGADGVHFPSDAARPIEARADDARRILGASVVLTTAAHDDEDVRRAVDAELSAVLVSPIFATPGKGTPRAVSALVSARRIVDEAADLREAGARARVPRVIALGGVSTDNARACAEAGADGIAVIRALLEARHDAARTRAVGGAAVRAVALALAAPFGLAVAGRRLEC